MSSPQPSVVQRKFGDFAPTLVGSADDVLFGDVWKRADLVPTEDHHSQADAEPSGAFESAPRRSR